MIAILDYGLGNLGSISNMLKVIGEKSKITNDVEIIRSADGIILPGVGAFDAGMNKLNESGLSEVIKDEVDFLRDVEKHAFSLVLSDKYYEKYDIDDEKIISEIKKMVEITERYGTGLLITDQIIEDAPLLQCGLNDFQDINGEFDYVIINLNKSLADKRDDECVDIILNILISTKIGGFVCIPESTYNYVPSKRKGVEALIEILNLRIEVPLHGIKSGILASKEDF